MPYFRAIADGLPSQTRFPPTGSQSPSQSHSRASSPPLSWLNALEPDLDPDSKDDDDDDKDDNEGAADTGIIHSSHTSPVPQAASTSPSTSPSATGARVPRPPLPAHPSDHTNSEHTHVDITDPDPDAEVDVDPGPSTPGAPLLPIHNVPTTAAAAAASAPASTSSSARRSAKGSHKTSSARRPGTPGWVREGVRVHWARFLRRVGGTVEYGESESIVVPSEEDDPEEEEGDGGRRRGVGGGGGGGRDRDAGGDGVPGRRSRTQSAEEELGKGAGATNVIISEVSNGNGLANGNGNGNGNGYAADLRGYSYGNRNGGREEEEDEDDASTVDEVVVDRTWGKALTGSDSTDGDADSGGGAPTGKGGGTHGHLPRVESGAASRTSNAGGGGRDSPSQLHLSGGGEGGGAEKGISAHGFWGLCLPLSVVRYRLWPQAMVFFSTRFVDEKSEAHYRKEVWFQSKPLALWSSLFFVINWILGCALAPKPFTLGDNVFYFAIAPVLTLPIPFFVIFDFARDRTFVYHVFVCISTWSWSIYQIIFIFVCGYYSSTHPSCGGRDFLSLFYYTSALQTIALFGLKLNRFPAMLGAVVFLVMAAGMVIPSRIGWIRNAINFLIFQSFLLYIHYMKETGERRLFTLRDELKKQFRATQKAQINETKAAESKRRLTSSVSRSTLPNMEASHAVPKDQDVEFQALSGSLSMMSKVLNDVLDFNRMDSGLLESVHLPYPLHGVMKSMFIPLRLATEARQLEFVTELDPSIDLVAQRAAWDSLTTQAKQQAGWETFEKYQTAAAADSGDGGGGIVVGDEMRLRQIVTNLVSNACKFTPTGGTLSVRTKLVAPAGVVGVSAGTTGAGTVGNGGSGAGEEAGSETLCARHVTGHGGGLSSIVGVGGGARECDLEKGECAALSARTLDQHNAAQQPQRRLDRIVVRIEVTDTGYGIRSKDIRKGKLFSAFNQTEQGRLQGGKGTGLGLALVRHIVSLSGGRLGVRSKVGAGSTFWVELPLGVGTKAVSATLTASGSEQDSSTFVSRGPGTSPASQAHNQRARSRSASVPRKASSTERPVRTVHKDVTPGTGGQIHAYTYPHGHTHGHGHNYSHGHVHTRSAHAHPAPASVLKSIMEQGGLVELKPSARPGSGGGIPTRAIGDPSTGTDTAGLGPPSPQDGDAEGAALAAQAGDVGVCAGAGAVNASNSDGDGARTGTADTGNSSTNSGVGSDVPASTQIVRPSYVELPKRPTFLGSTTATPLSVSSTSTLFAPPAPSPITSSPVPPATPTSVAAAAAAGAGAQDPPLRVLVVDDDQLTRKLMRRMLQRLGCAVSTAENGQVAFDLITGEGRTPASEAGEPGMGVAAAGGAGAGSVVGASANAEREGSSGFGAPTVAPVPSEQDSGTPPAAERPPPQFDGPRYELIFLDNQMPVLSGLDLVGKMRQMGRTDFVVGVTGNALLSDQEEYLEAGVDYVITKPVFEAKLKGMLHIAAERRKNEMQAPVESFSAPVTPRMATSFSRESSTS